MSSSCLSGGGGRAYGFDLDIVKSQSPSSRCSHSSSSPSSTLSESSNSPPLAITTKKSRTPRKRPNQTYTEAAGLLAKLYPTIFSTKNLRKHRKFTKPCHAFIDTSALLPPFPCLSDAGFLLHQPVVLPEKTSSQFEPKAIPESSCSSPEGLMDYRDEMNSSLDDNVDFDAESILDEEVGEGIDSIMGNPICAGKEPPDYSELVNPYLGHLVGMFQANMTRALRHVGNGDWWCSPTVEMQNIVPKLKSSSSPEKKKKKKKVEKPVCSTTAISNSNSKTQKSKGEAEDSSSSSSATQASGRSGLSLKLNFDRVMDEWSGRGSPFSEVVDSSESPAAIIAKLSDIDLLSEVAASGGGGVRGACVLRYKEKRRSRLFSKKIGYQVSRKVTADNNRRPRTKASSVGPLT